MIRIVLCGILGRLGGEVLAACEKSGDIEVVCGIDSAALLQQCGPPVYSSFCSGIPQADAVVDCSSPTLQKQVLEYCVQTKLPLLCCVTGYSGLQEQAFEAASGVIPVVRCVNMASALPGFIRLLRYTAAMLHADEAYVVETHCSAKKDAPSGTALLLAEVLRSCGCTARISWVRLARAEASHKVLFYSQGQRIELRHVCCDTAAYGEGALALIRQMGMLSAGLYRVP